MDYQELDQKIRVYRYIFDSYQQQLQDIISQNQQYTSKLLDQAEDKTQKLQQTIQNILMKEKQNNINHLDKRQIVWNDPKPTERIKYKKHKQYTIIPKLNSNIQQSYIILTLRFKNIRHIVGARHSLYQSQSKIPQKFKLQFYMFGKRFQTQYLTIINNQIIRYDEYYYFNKKQYFKFVYEIDLLQFNMPHKSSCFLESIVTMVCLNQQQFVFGVANCQMKQLICQTTIQHCFQLLNQEQQYLQFMAVSYCQIRQSKIEKQNSQNIDLFSNQHTLLPILIINDKNYKKIFTLKFSCPYNTPIFLTSFDQFKKYNINSQYQFIQPNFISDNQIELQAGDQIFVYLLVYFQNDTQRKDEQFVLQTMGHQYNIKLHQYHQFKIHKYKDVFNIPNNQFIEANGLVFFRKNQQMRFTKLDFVVGQYKKIYKNIVAVYPQSVKSYYFQNSTYVCCYHNTAIAYKNSKQSKITICSIQTTPNKGVHTINAQRILQPQLLDFSQILQAEVQYNIQSQNIETRILCSKIYFEKSQKRELWIEINCNDYQKHQNVYITNLTNMSTTMALINFLQK